MALSQRPFAPGPNLPGVQSFITQSVQGEGPGPLPASQSLSTTAETLLTNPAQPTLALSCAVPPNTNLEQIPIEFNLSGVITTKATGNLTLKVYSGIAIASGSLLGSSGAIAGVTSGGSSPFWASAKLIFDSVSGKLDGKIEFFVNHTLVAAVAVSNTITGVSNTNDPVAQFCASLTSSGADGTHLTTINTQNMSCG
jgi:hypothetical protein